jgi:hypothetical protein
MILVAVGDSEPYMNAWAALDGNRALMEQTEGVLQSPGDWQLLKNVHSKNSNFPICCHCPHGSKIM